MKSLPLKLGIFIVVLFGLVILGFVLYEPLWWKWYEARLQSNDKSTRDAAAEAIAGRDRNIIIPRLRKWLESDNERNIEKACLVLGEFKDKSWEKLLPELERILDGIPSNKTDSVSMVMVKQSCSGFDKYFKKPNRRQNIMCYLLLNSNDDNIRIKMAKFLGPLPHIESYKQILAIRAFYSTNPLGECWDVFNIKSIPCLKEAFENDKNKDVRIWTGIGLGWFGKRMALKCLVNALINEKDDDIRAAAAFSLAQTSLHESDCYEIEVLAKVLAGDSDKRVRYYAALALNGIETKEAVNALGRALLNDAEPHVREVCARLLGYIGNKKAIDYLLDAMNDKTNKEMFEFSRYWEDRWIPFSLPLNYFKGQSCVCAQI